MRLAISASGLSSATATLPPIPAGKRWRILSAFVSLTSSSTVGSRYVYLVVAPPGSGQQYTLAVTTQGSTSASTTTNGAGNPTGTGGSAGPTTFYSVVVAVTGDILETQASLLTGDTYSYYVEIEEEEDN